MKEHAVRGRKCPSHTSLLIYAFYMKAIFISTIEYEEIYKYTH